ncbi:hypothetical protein BGZ76_006261, partial [Entomortierella beljakovae]
MTLSTEMFNNNTFQHNQQSNRNENPLASPAPSQDSLPSPILGHNTHSTPFFYEYPERFDSRLEAGHLYSQSHFRGNFVHSRTTPSTLHQQGFVQMQKHGRDGQMIIPSFQLPTTRSQSAIPSDPQPRPMMAASQSQFTRSHPATMLQSVSATPVPSHPRLILQAPSSSNSGIGANTKSLETRSTRTKGNGRDFWKAPGMDLFVEWMTDPENHAKLSKKRPVSGQKASDLHLVIANYVNGIIGTKWTKEIVKGKIQYTKQKYDEATRLKNITGGGETKDMDDLREKMLALCPDYDKFHEVWGGTLSRDPPPPVQTGSAPKKDTTGRESSTEASDLGDDSSDDDGDDDDGDDDDGDDDDGDDNDNNDKANSRLTHNVEAEDAGAKNDQDQERSKKRQKTTKSKGKAKPIDVNKTLSTLEKLASGAQATHTREIEQYHKTIR